ncbi:MAG: hypothetical protein JWR30_3578, partial [Conexibacter sp.]|nr:hypothetical protein [Conexibacter sp.]
ATQAPPVAPEAPRGRAGLSEED